MRVRCFGNLFPKLVINAGFGNKLPKHRKINVTGPVISLNFHTYSGQPDLAAWKDEDGNIKGGLVFVSHEYDQGDLFFVDYVYCDGGCYILDIGTFDHFTRLRRMTNLGDVMEAKMTDLIMLPL